MEEVRQHGCVVGSLVEDAQCLVEDGFFDVGGWLFAQDGEQGGDHGEAAGVGVGFDFLGLFLVAGFPEPAGGVGGFAGVEDVEVAAAASEVDDLAVEGGDHVDVVGFQVAEDHGEDSVAGQPGGHPADGGGFAEGGEAEEEHAGVADQFGALEPGDRVAAQGGAGADVTSERDTDHGGAGPGRPRPQPTHLDGGGPELGCRIDQGRRTPAAADPAPHPRPGRRALRPLLRRGCGGHSFSLNAATEDTSFGRTRPRGRAAAKPLSWAP